MAVKVLVIDDDCSMRTSLLRVLRAHGLNAEGAANTSQALDTAMSFAPDVIVLDLLMDEDDGLLVAEALKRHPEFRRVPIVVLTASPDLARAAEPLFKIVLTKPCRSAELLRAIEESINPSPTDSDPTHPHRTA